MKKRARRTPPKATARAATRTATAPASPTTVHDFRGAPLQTGSVADVTRALPQIVYVPVDPETASTDSTSAAAMASLPAPERVYLKVRDRDADRAREFIAATGIVEVVDSAYAASRIKQGRRALLNTRAILVAMQLLVSMQRPLLLTEVRDILFCSISATQQRLLGVPQRPVPTGSAPALRRWDAATQGLVRRAFRRLLAPIDPSVLPKGRVLPVAEAARLKKDLTRAEQQDRAIALDFVCNQLLAAAYQQLPTDVRTRHAQNSAYCIDATPLPLFARGRGLDSDTISSDPDGGWYVRLGDHLDPNETPGKFVRTTDKFIYARDVHLIVTADASDTPRQYVPALPLAMTSDIPGMDPAGAARRLFANLAHRNHTPGPLAGDLLYTDQKAHKFQTPAREAGYDLVLGYGKDQTGMQEGHATGMNLVDGNYYAPCMPDELVDIVARLRAKEIDLQEFQRLVKRRVEYRMRTKDAPKPGRKERLLCPASGPAAQVKCALKPDSMTPRPIKHPNGVEADLRRTIKHLPVLTNDVAPTVCQQQAVTVEATDGAKYRQRLQYGTEEHTSLYHRLRQSQEGVHGSAKNEASVALSNPGRRRVHGWAAQQLFAAFLLARTATERIATFLRDAVRDESNALYVPRSVPTTNDKPRVTSGAPPGAENPGSD